MAVAYPDTISETNLLVLALSFSNVQELLDSHIPDPFMFYREQVEF